MLEKDVVRLVRGDGGDMGTVLSAWLPTDKVNRKAIARCKHYEQLSTCNSNQ